MTISVSSDVYALQWAFSWDNSDVRVIAVGGNLDALKCFASNHRQKIGKEALVPDDWWQYSDDGWPLCCADYRISPTVLIEEIDQ